MRLFVYFVLSAMPWLLLNFQTGHAVPHKTGTCQLPCCGALGHSESNGNENEHKLAFDETRRYHNSSDIRVRTIIKTAETPCISDTATT